MDPVPPPSSPPPPPSFDLGFHPSTPPQPMPAYADRDLHDFSSLLRFHVDRPVLDFIDGILMEADDFDDDDHHLRHQRSASASFRHDLRPNPALEGDQINFLYNSILQDFYEILASSAGATNSSSTTTSYNAQHLNCTHPSGGGGGVGGVAAQLQEPDFSGSDSRSSSSSAAAEPEVSAWDPKSGSASVLISGFANSAAGAPEDSCRVGRSVEVLGVGHGRNVCNGTTSTAAAAATSATRYPWQKQQQRWRSGKNRAQSDVIAEKSTAYNVIEIPNRTNFDDHPVDAAGLGFPPPPPPEWYRRPSQLKPIIIDSTSHYVTVNEVNRDGSGRWRRRESTPPEPSSAAEHDAEFRQQRHQSTGQSRRRIKATSFKDLESSGNDFSFGDQVLELQAEYEKLYLDLAPEKTTGGGGGGGSKRKDGGAPPGYYDVEEMLLSCAQAVARSEVAKARSLVSDAKRMASQGRSSLHRMALHFCNALEARLDGTGATLYAASARFGALPSSDTVRALRRLFTAMHSIKMSHFIANQTIIAAAQGHRRLHIVDYGIGFGLQWPHLIKALSEREGGAPYVVMTGVEQPFRGRSHDGRGAAELVEETGRRLAEYARQCGVPFEFYAVTSKDWEELEEAELKVGEGGGVLVVNTVKRMETVAEESAAQMQLSGGGGGGGGRRNSASRSNGMSARQKLLCRIRQLKPELMVIGVSNGTHNAPTFMTRFRETLRYYTAVYEMLEATGMNDCPERLLLEKRMIEPSIVNTVACEGRDRVERPESYRQWQGRLQRAGFRPLPLQQPLVSRAAAYVRRHYHPDSTVVTEEPWLLFGWRGRISLALSAWSPKAGGGGGGGGGLGVHS